MSGRWFRTIVLVCVAAAVAGTALRFEGISKQVYRNDEAWTMLWISGHSYREIQNKLCGRLSSPEELRAYLRVTPGRGVSSTIAAVATDDPKQTPVYFGLLRLWVAVAGDSRGAARFLSVLFGMLVLPAAFLVGRELDTLLADGGARDGPAARPGRFALTGWVAAALIAVSPVHILYAQDLRPYSLYTLMVLLTSWALLRAMRLETAGAWRLYTAMLIAGLYVHPLVILVVLAHAAYAILRCGGRGAVRLESRTGALSRFARSLFWAAVAFLPWGVIFLLGWRRGLGGMRWLLNPIPFRFLFESWMSAWGRIFVDLTELSSAGAAAPWLPLTLYSALTALIIVSLVQLWRGTSRRVWALPLSLFTVPLLVLVPPDIILGGQSSVIDRYMVAGFVGADLAVACLLARMLSGDALRRSFAAALLAALLVGGVATARWNVRLTVPWIKGWAREYAPMATVINQPDRSLLVCDCPTVVRLLSFSPFLGNGVTVELLRADDPLVVPPGMNSAYLFRGPVGSDLDGRFNVEPVSGTTQLWQMQALPGGDTGK